MTMQINQNDARHSLQERIYSERRTLIMGILNVTPDSFSDGGSYTTVEQAVRRAREMVKEGADIIDIGGESTRPGAQSVSEADELQRVIPVVEALARTVNVPLSVDTYKAEVAERSLAAGAHIMNDIWGLKKDPRMAEVAARRKCPLIIMHNREQTEYSDFVSDVMADLRESIALAHQSGVDDNQIILDPGFGFAKDYKQNLHLMTELSRIHALGYPVLLGTSRKGMIKKTLDQDALHVVEGTAATVVMGIAQGCKIMRVHDVKEMRKVADMTDAMMHARNESGGFAWIPSN